MGQLFCQCGNIMNEEEVEFCIVCGDVCCNTCSHPCESCGEIECQACHESEAPCLNCFLLPKNDDEFDVFIVFEGSKTKVKNKDILLKAIAENGQKTILELNNRLYRFSHGIEFERADESHIKDRYEYFNKVGASVLFDIYYNEDSLPELPM